MASTEITLIKEDGWVSLADASCDFQNDSDSVLRYEFDTTKPADTVRGYSLPARTVRAVELSGGQVWGRNLGNSPIDVIVNKW